MAGGGEFNVCVIEIRRRSRVLLCLVWSFSYECVSCYASVKPADGVGSYETRGWLRKLRSSPSGHSRSRVTSANVNPFPLSHQSTCWDSQMEKQTEGGIDPGGLITPSAADFNKRNLKKRGLIHLPGLLVLIESNYSICVVNIISWRSRSTPPLLDFSASGSFTEMSFCYMRERLLNPRMESSPRRRWLTGKNTCWPASWANEAEEKARKWKFNSSSDLTKREEKRDLASFPLQIFFFFFCCVCTISNISEVKKALF